jgi:MoaD family protein
MAVAVKIPVALRPATGGESEVSVEGATVAEVLDALFERFGELRARISDEQGSLRRFVNVYVGGEDIRFLEGLDTPVTDGSELTILPAVAGGGGVAG